MPNVQSFAQILKTSFDITVQSFLDIALSPPALGAICRLANKASDTLRSKGWTLHPSAVEPHIRYEGQILPLDALRLDRLQVCPRCLLEDTYLRYDWDFHHVVACGRHKCLLTAACPNCQAPLPANQLFIGYCRNCGSALSATRTSPAAPDEIAASEDAAGLGPIMGVGAQAGYLMSPAIFFDLFRLFCVKDIDACRNKATAHMTKATFPERLLAAQRVGAARCPNGYIWEILRRPLAQAVAHLSTLEEYGAVEHKLRKLLHASTLTPETQHFLMGSSEQASDRRAAFLEGAKPDSDGVRAATTLLGVSSQGISWLKRTGYLRNPIAGGGYATYDILDARELLRCLIPTSRFDEAMDIQGISNAAAQVGLLDVWPGYDIYSRGVTRSSAVTLLDGIRIKSLENPAQQKHRLTSIATISSKPDTVALILHRLLTGDFAAIKWGHPWRLTDLSYSDE